MTSEDYCKFGNDLWGKNMDMAIEAFSMAIESDPDNAFAYGCRGDGYFQKSEYDKAIADYTEQIRLDPKNYYPHITRGDSYRAKGDLERAAADYMWIIDFPLGSLTEIEQITFESNKESARKRLKAMK